MTPLAPENERRVEEYANAIRASVAMFERIKRKLPADADAERLMCDELSNAVTGLLTDVLGISVHVGALSHLDAGV